MTTSNHHQSCCGPECCGETSVATVESQESVRQAVREGYATIARRGQWSSAPQSNESSATCYGGGAQPGSGGGCCGATTLTADQIASAVGYAHGELEALPDGANMGLSCGNPTTIASLKPGEIVLDLGSGGGFDCFIAGPKVGANGRVIGVDMTPDMITKARRNIESYRRSSGLDNVEFRLGEIEYLPVADASVDVVISNCVLNLSPDKPQVWREIARVLKPGGRVAVSDLALVQPLPASIRRDIEALVGCVAGAALIDETRRMAEAAGLVDIILEPKHAYIDAMNSWQDPLYQRIISQLPAGAKTSDYITSLDVRTRKGSDLVQPPGGGCSSSRASSMLGSSPGS